MGRGWADLTRSTLGGLQTPTGTIDRDFGAFREASRHRQARQIVSCEPPRHRQGRWIVTWGVSRGFLEGLGHRQGRWIVILEAPRASKILQQELVGLPNTSRSHPTAYMKPMSSAQTESTNIPTSLQRRYHQGASGGMRGAVGIST